MTYSTFEIERMKEQLGPVALSTIIDTPKPEPPEEDDSWWKGWIKGTGLEIGAGYGTDLTTAGLLNPATIAGTGGWSIAGYAGLNFTSGALSNYYAQKLRGEENISWGEVLSSGAVDIIPYIGQKLKGLKAVGSVAVQSGAKTLLQRQGEVFIDQKRPLTTEEAATSFGVGAAFGGTFKVATDALPGAIKSTNELRTRLKEQIRGIKSIATGEGLTEVGTGIRTGGGVLEPGAPDHIRRNPNTGAIEQHPDLVKPVTRRQASDISEMGQSEKSDARTFQRLTREEQQKFARDIPQAAEEVTKTAGNPFSPHHVWPLKTLPTAVDYLDDEGMEMSLRFLREGLGDVKFGDAQSPYMAYGKFHDKLHDYMHLEMGDNWNLVRYLERRHFGDRKLSDGISIQERMKPGGFYEDVIKVLKEQKRFIDTFQTALAGQSNWSASTPTEFVDRVISKASLNEEFKKITRRLIARSTSPHPSGGKAPHADVRQIIDEIIGEALNEELRSAVIQRNDEIKKLLDNQPSNSAKLKLAEKQINLKLRKFIAETKGYYKTQNIRRNRVRDFVDEYKIFDYGFSDDQMDDLISGLITHVDDHGVYELPPTLKEPIKRWMGWN